MSRINISNLLRVMYFVAAVCIVAIHANTVHVVAHPAAWNLNLHHVVCECLTGWAVPFFFVCSGFFFARGRYVREGGYRPFIAGKAQSILIPYLAWSVIAAVVLIPLVVANNWYAHHPLFERTVFSANGLVDGFVQLFGIRTTGGPRHNGPLWFLRALMILFLFAPLWRYLIRRWFGRILLLGAFIGLLFYKCPPSLLGYAWEYFFLGAVLGASLPASVMDTHDGQLLGRIPGFFKLSFWLYCTHNILLGWILAVGHFAFGKTDLAVALLTCCAIPITVVVSLLLARSISRLFPNSFRSLNGGRAYL